MKIILEDRTGAGFPSVRDSLALPLPDLAPLKLRYGKKAFSRQAFEGFKRDWEGPEGKEIREPAATLAIIRTEDLKLVSGIEEETGNAERAIAALWTLGEKLENHASRLLDGQKEIEGILYNVVGSLTLVGMHAKIRQWIAERFAGPQNLNIVGEFYPGGPCLGMDTLPVLLDLADRERTLGVSCRGGELLHPLKSGCALFLLGKGEEKILSPVEPCKPCLGKKCLYFQMGGCHIACDEDNQAL